MTEYFSGIKIHEPKNCPCCIYGASKLKAMREALKRILDVVEPPCSAEYYDRFSEMRGIACEAINWEQ